MCQKAFGAFFGPYVAVQPHQVTWTRGAPAHFQSSNKVRRGFCPACGTQLTFEGTEADAPWFDLAIGAFDQPQAIRPTVQLGLEGKLPYVDELASLREQKLDDAAVGYYASVVSHQHPDHDT
ncbi:GFA family protein [Phenylobacterium deserti]|uniref:GFA family protein n=2 Tax=Phenylobacterium deserti TaxID=1914756 RepID=A0A328AV36_9CAUL|nr:GFA family protein [Phenylobacterium deserti]